MISTQKVISAFRQIEASRDFSCILAPFPWKIAEEIRTWSQNNILEQDLTDDGLESHVHVTVKYGLHNHDPYEIRPIIRDFGPIKLTLGKISLFENDEHDVVKISIQSNGLIKLNKLIASKFENTETHPQYIPHCTLAYVKSGMGKKYAGRTDFSGKEVIIKEIIFSGNDYRETIFSL